MIFEMIVKISIHHFVCQQKSLSGLKNKDQVQCPINLVIFAGTQNGQ
jgi:hypothetical protein